MRVECGNENLMVIEEGDLLMMANLKRKEDALPNVVVPGHSILKQRTVLYFAERYTDLCL